MKKSLLVLFAVIALNVANAQTGRYKPYSYKSSYSEEVKEISNSVIEITLRNISVKVGGNRAFVYRIINKEIDKQVGQEDYTIYLVVGTDNKQYEFTTGKSNNGYFVMHAEGYGSYILYFCNKE